MTRYLDHGGPPERYGGAGAHRADDYRAAVYRPDDHRPDDYRPDGYGAADYGDAGGHELDEFDERDLFGDGVRPVILEPPPRRLVGSPHPFAPARQSRGAAGFLDKWR